MGPRLRPLVEEDEVGAVLANEVEGLLGLRPEVAEAVLIEDLDDDAVVVRVELGDGNDPVKDLLPVLLDPHAAAIHVEVALRVGDVPPGRTQAGLLPSGKKAASSATRKLAGQHQHNRQPAPIGTRLHLH
ncbi:MAG: hypothetical protein KKA97_08930, partial [Actinobacteria bacterium]|nr:hypothetical protein [Actinomycetota bacterium]